MNSSFLQRFPKGRQRGQADRRRSAVRVLNQRTMAGILDMAQVLGALVGAGGQAAALVAQCTAGLDAITDSAAHLPRRSRVYFEEWDEPMISGVGWVSELIRIADGEDCFPELAGAQAARYRVIADPAQAMAAQS